MSEAVFDSLTRRRELSPAEIVAELDKHIVGQARAKRAVAIALRNRLRRQRLPEELRVEVHPKNILMIGPTGVGKTEIARRLARLVNAPFTKIEATKYTEVGYVGRDVESIIRDLVQVGYQQVRAERIGQVQDQAARRAEERLLELLLPSASEQSGDRSRDRLRQLLREGRLDQREVEVELPESSPQAPGAGAMEEMGVSIQQVLGDFLPRRTIRRRMTVKDAGRVIQEDEADRLIDKEDLSREAVRRTEETGIVFLDELDKVAGNRDGSGPDVSGEGVQRDLLPIVEGTQVNTRHGVVRTDHVLFIAAGAFNVSKPSDLIPELQGRFPIRVELDPLGADEFQRILTEPEHSLTRQYQALLATDGVLIEFDRSAILTIAEYAVKVNEAVEDIGARRLHTVLERILEDAAFGVDLGRIVVDEAYVRDRLDDLAGDEDLSRYIL